ncbi:MAG TPA: T9SS type A sorting domain-containing protein [Lacibacter sp.]|nr:T9SS type A sorting domain-containing protein [Lacibacter sp.]
MKPFFLLISLFAFQSVLAQWNSDVTVNNPICTAAGEQYNAIIAPDGAGGAIIAWSDNRSGNFDIYAQRINASGAVQWATDGVVICAASGDQFFPVIISDGNGGAIISWTDYRNDVSFTNTDIFAQRINASGAVQWTVNGIAVCNNNTNQRSVRLAAFGSGGAVFTWSDDRNGTTNSDIYAQAVDGSGNFLWTVNGVAVCTSSSYQIDPVLISDGSTAVTIVWLDNRSGNYDIYAQKLNASAVPQWTVNGTVICNAAGMQGNCRIISDGVGGAILAWDDGRGGSATDIYAQRIDASGVAQWAANGTVVSNASNIQIRPELIADGTGGAIMAWLDYRNGLDFSIRDIYAQRINSSGISQWTSNGLAICTATNHQQDYNLVTDGLNGAIIAWYDARSGTGDIYVQHVTASGTPTMAANGFLAGGAADRQEYPVLVSDEANGAILAWADKRNGVANDIYAYRLFYNTITSVRNISHEKTITVFPSPVKSNQSIVIKNARALIAVYGIDGKRYDVPASKSFTEVQTLQLPALPTGVYILELKNKNNKAEFIQITVY